MPIMGPLHATVDKKIYVAWMSAMAKFVVCLKGRRCDPSQNLGTTSTTDTIFSKVAKLGYRKRPASPLATCHVLINSS